MSPSTLGSLLLNSRSSTARPLAAALILISALTLSACGTTGGESSAAAEWQSETRTEGNLTTVRTVSGSVWGGTATLEEVVSIGVESGEDAYMFGSIRAIAEDGGEIFVLDQQVPVVRVYDSAGRHLRDLGTEGSGPGEFQRPESMLIGADGRLYIRDPRNGRIMILSKSGEELGTIRITSSFSTSNPLVMTNNGTLYNYELLNNGADVTDWNLGMVPQYEDEEMEGDPIEAPEFDYEPPQIVARRDGGTSINSVPFAAQVHWNLSATGAVIGGVGDDYSFDVRYPDGHITRVQKAWAPLPIDPAEAEWFKKRATANMRGMVPDWTWNGPEIPARKPAFSALDGDVSGRIWVRRPGAGYHVDEECTEEPEPGAAVTACWRQATSWEVFDEEGRFLGGVEIPEGVQTFPRPYIRDDVYLAAFMDEFGTITVKQFRLVLPGN